MKLPRIYFFLTSKKTASSIRVMRDLACSLHDNGLARVEVVFLKDDDGLDFSCPSQYKSFFKKVDIETPCIIHSSGIRPDAYCLFHYTGSDVARCTTIHSDLHKDLSNKYGLLSGTLLFLVWRYLILWGVNIFVPSNFLRLKYTRRDSDQIYTVNNGTRSLAGGKLLAQHSRLTELFRRYKTIGAHAIFTKIKGLDLLIKAVASDQNYALCLVGDGPDLNKLKRMARQLNAIDRIIFMGYVDDVSGLFSFYDYYAAPSYSEGMPLSVLEAMSCGKKLILSDIPIFREMFDSEEVTFFAAGDFIDLSEKLKYLSIRDRGVSIRMKQLFDEHYTVERMVENYCSHYNRLLKV